MWLRAVDDQPAERGVSDETAAGKRRTRAIVHQRALAVYLHPAEGGGLRDGPELAAVAAGTGLVDVDRQVRQRAPEVVERRAEVGGGALVVDIYRSIDDDVPWRQPEARYGRGV